MEFYFLHFGNTFPLAAIFPNIMRINLLLLSLSFLIQDIVFCQDKKLLPDSSIVFDVSNGNKLLEDCSGSELQKVADSFWIPNQNDYQALQLNFYKLTNQVQDLNNYIIQYIGITLEGGKYIYINAFHKSAIEDIKRLHQDLKSTAVVYCGGGIEFWRVLFDVNLKKFDEIRINAPK